MDTQDEKFFEALAKGVPDEPEVELAKADASAVASRARASSRAAAKAPEPAEAEGQLTVDVFQTPNDIFVESAIAGVKPEDIDVNVTPDSVSIRGARAREEREEGKDYIYQECYWGRFGRSIILPQEIDPENADVRFKNGILTIRLPKANKRKTRKLNVRVE
jgi:HSP20 family protein